MNSFLYQLCFFLVFSVTLLGEEIVGFWQAYDNEKNKPGAVIAIYPYKDKFYGRVIGSFNDQGQIDDTIENPKDRAAGIEGNPFYTGLDILDLKLLPDGTYKGFVVDPRRGKKYNAKAWREGDNLILRGEVFIFGKNQTWPPFSEEKFNETFQKPDVSCFIPKSPTLRKCNNS